MLFYLVVDQTATSTHVSVCYDILEKLKGWILVRELRLDTRKDLKNIPLLLSQRCITLYVLIK